MTLFVVHRHSRYAEGILAKLVSLEEYGSEAYLGESINNLARRTRELIEACCSTEEAPEIAILTSRIEALEEENEELHDSLEAAFLGTPGWRDKARQALAKKEE